LNLYEADRVEMNIGNTQQNITCQENKGYMFWLKSDWPSSGQISGIEEGVYFTTLFQV